MRPFFFLTLLTSVAFIEVFTFIQASSYINVLIIFALTVFTALIGLSLAKKQIVSAFSNLKQVSNTKETFLNHMVDGVGALVAGFLLLLPGFCTDLIGVLLLVPASRKLLLSFGFQYFLERVYTFHSQNKQNFDDPNDTIIEGDVKSRSYSEDTDKTKPLT